MYISEKTSVWRKMSYPMGEEVPLKYKMLVGLTPCMMFVLTGIIGYGTTNVLPEVVENANAVALYSVVTLLIQVVNTLSSPLAGCLGDIFGRKKLIVGCLVPFTISTALIGLSQNALVLCIAIFVMSFTFSICQSSTSAMIFDAVEGKLMSTLMGIRHSAGQMAFLLGPIVAGVLTTAIGARNAYLLMAPLGLISLILVALFTPDIKYQRKSSRIDWLGTLLLFLSMGGISLLLTLGGSSFSWISVNSLVLLLLFLLGGYFFYQTEKKADNPVIELSIFSHREMMPMMLYKILMQTSNGVFGAYLILYCQEIMNMSSAKTGLFGLARIAAILGSSFVGGWMARKKCLLASEHAATLMCFAAGMIGVFIWPEMPFGILMLSQILISLNTSFGTIPLTLVIPAVLPKEQVGNGYGYGVFYFSENLGSVLGTAVSALIINLMGGDIGLSFRYIALSFVIFTIMRFFLTIKQFPALKNVIQKL